MRTSRLKPYWRVKLRDGRFITSAGELLQTLDRAMLHGHPAKLEKAVRVGRSAFWESVEYDFPSYFARRLESAS